MPPSEPRALSFFSFSETFQKMRLGPMCLKETICHAEYRVSITPTKPYIFICYCSNFPLTKLDRSGVSILNRRLPPAVQENSASSSKLRRLVHLSMFVLILYGQFIIVRMHCVLCKLGYNQDWAFWVFRNLVMIFFFFPFAL